MNKMTTTKTNFIFFASNSIVDYYKRTITQINSCPPNHQSVQAQIITKASQQIRLTIWQSLVIEFKIQNQQQQ